MRRFFKYSFLLVNILFALLLACTRILPHANPYEYSYLGLLGLIAPLLLVLNLIFILFWLITRKFLYLLVPFFAIAFSWKVLSVCFAYHIGQQQNIIKSNSAFSVMSYNVRLLDFYNWSADKNTRSKMLDFFKEKNPTILCLQEFYSSNGKNGVNNIKAIQEICHYEYVAECNMQVTKRGKWGSVIFSHLPIVNSKNYEIDVQSGNLLQRADIAQKGDTFSIYNVHMKSNKLSKTESDLINIHEVPALNDSNLSKSKSIFKKLYENSANRGLESDIVATVIAQHKKPAIVCGDLNDLPSSYVYFTVRDTLNDAFLEKGFGLGRTYRNNPPLFRIDYIFYHPHFSLSGFETISVPYSDHNPLLANFSLSL